MVLALQPGDVEAALELEFETFQFDRFTKEIIGSRAHGAQRVLPFSLTGDDDDLRELVDSQHLGKGSQPLGRIIGVRRKTQIEHRHRWSRGLESLERPRAALRQENLVLPVQRPFHLGADFLIVVNDEQLRLHGTSAASGKLTRKVVPLPTALSTWMVPRLASIIILD